MPATARLPDAMPDVDRVTLLLVCDGHHCRVLRAAGRDVTEMQVVEADERPTTERDSQLRGPGGVISGTTDVNQIEEHRLRAFANKVAKHLESLVATSKATALYLSAPAKPLSALRAHLSKPLAALVTGSLEGTFTKEAPLVLLTRFRPDLAASVQALRDQEGFSPRKHPPKK